jgi:peptidoglycan/xylan/chitin deacetylase (PgdA/CDA1 family)
MSAVADWSSGLSSGKGFLMAIAYLTFDDGPDPVWTPRLLDVLGGAGAVATFFPIAARAAEHPDVVRRIVVDGHTIGLHCYEHLRHSSRGIEWGRRDVTRGLAVLSRLGPRPSVWRTPWGDTAPWSEQVARENGLRIAGWDLDTHDWRGDSAEDMFRATAGGLRDGAVVLAHDGVGPGARRPDARESVRYTELVIDHLREAGLELGALS